MGGGGITLLTNQRHNMKNLVMRKNKINRYTNRKRGPWGVYGMKGIMGLGLYNN